jgi:DNA-binding LacI/PurR family transcriptional regulator
MPTLKDVAVAAQVSTVTASSVLSGANRVRVSRETALRIHSVAKKMNYVPRAAARGLRTGRVMSIAFVNAAHSIRRWQGEWQEVLRGVGDVLWSREEHLILSLPKSQEHEVELLRQLAFGHQVDGLIIQDILQNDPRVDLLSESGVAFVGLGGEANPDIHKVDLDLENFASDLSARLLAKAGGLCVLGHKPRNLPDAAVLEKYRDETVSRNKAYFEWTGALLPEAGWFRQAADNCKGVLRILLMRNLLPELITTLNDAGLKLAQDVTVTFTSGADGVVMPPPGLEIIPMDYYTLGRRAAQLLFRIIDKEEFAPASLKLVPPCEPSHFPPLG